MRHLAEVVAVAELLHSKCEEAQIPAFATVQYDLEDGLAQFHWDGTEFGLVVLLEGHELGRLSAAELRELWDDELERGAAASLASEAMLN